MMRIWVPANLAVVVDDPTLNLIVPKAQLSSISSTCNTPLYQGTAVYATCDFVGGGPTISGVDVTSLVTFVSTSSSVAIINNYIQGVSTGASIPVGIKQVSSLTAGTTVSVVSTYACLTKISVVAYTGASWLSPPASISPIGAVTAQLLPLQVTLLQPSVLELVVPQWDLSSKSQTAAIRAYASYSDGYMNDVTDLPGLDVSTLAPSYIHVNDPLAAEVVASYGNASYCGNGLNASLAVCSIPIGTGRGPINVTLPLPFAVQSFTATPSDISISGDPATSPLLSVATTSSLSVQMAFSDGTVRDFSTDSRAVFTVLTTLVLRPQNYDFTGAQGVLATVASAAPQYTALQPIACTTSDYEQATLWMLGVLNNGTAYDLTTVGLVLM
ncbi:hypothetical protein ABBQ38_014062 [Trebouxia sp. C0009 RCD-2024]